MTSRVEVARQYLDGLVDVPDHIRESLISCGLPSGFDRFDICFSVDSLKIADWNDNRFLILGETESGAVAVDLVDASVWWLLGEVSQPPELRSRADRQFINSSIRAFVSCVEACAALLTEAGPDSARLQQIVRSADEEALASERQGVWRDVVLDWEAGL